MKLPFLLLLFILFFSKMHAQETAGEVHTVRQGIKPVSFMPVRVQHPGSYSLPMDGNISETLNNKPLLQTATKNGKLHGVWQSWYQNGNTCDSGSFIKGLPDGMWKYWNESGELMAIRTYSADKYQRISHEMLRYHPRRVTYPLAALYQVNRYRARAYMEASYSFEIAGKRTTGLSLKETITGNITAGNAYRPVFDHALHHGLFVNFYSGGMVKDSGYYHNGLRQGIWIHRDMERGIKEKGTYNHGIKVKEWRVYNTDGKLEELIIYTSRGKIKKKKDF